MAGVCFLAQWWSVFWWQFSYLPQNNRSSAGSGISIFYRQSFDSLQKCPEKWPGWKLSMRKDTSVAGLIKGHFR
jgi:hypothetical protein